MYRYQTRGTCSREIIFDIENDMLKEVHFVSGCMGNTTGVARLAENRPVDEVISLLEGIDCGGRGTSCPDQLAQALKLYKQNMTIDHTEDVSDEDTSDKYTFDEDASGEEPSDEGASDEDTTEQAE